MNWKVKKLDILVILTAGILLLDIPYINHISDPRFAKIILSIFVLVSDVVYLVKNKIIIRIEHWLLLFATLCIVLSTAVSNGMMLSCLSDLSVIIAVCFLIIICKEKQQVIREFKLWCHFFFALLLIDTFTMIMWPKGLYISTYVRNNWFLGYKTVRLTYTFTLLLLYNYTELLSKKEITRKSYVLAFLVILNTFLSNASGATIAVCIYSLMVFCAFGPKKTRVGRLIKKLSWWLMYHHVWVLAVWFVCYILIVVFYDSTIVQSIISQMEKEYSFGQRTIAWTNTLTTIKNHWVLGVGIQGRQSTMSITGGLANAHNMIFTYLLTGGIVGLGLLTYVIYSALRHIKTNFANYIVMIFFYCIMFLGIVSSVMAFCPFFFAALLIPLKTSKLS